jgi:hypothetical protein
MDEDFALHMTQSWQIRFIEDYVVYSRHICCVVIVFVSYAFLCGLFNEAASIWTRYRRMVGWLINYELERIWKDQVLA